MNWGKVGTRTVLLFLDAVVFGCCWFPGVWGFRGNRKTNPFATSQPTCGSFIFRRQWCQRNFPQKVSEVLKPDGGAQNKDMTWMWWWVTDISQTWRLIPYWLFHRFFWWILMAVGCVANVLLFFLQQNQDVWSCQDLRLPIARVSFYSELLIPMGDSTDDPFVKQS